MRGQAQWTDSFARLLLSFLLYVSTPVVLRGTTGPIGPLADLYPIRDGYKMLAALTPQRSHTTTAGSFLIVLCRWDTLYSNHDLKRRASPA